MTDAAIEEMGPAPGKIQYDPDSRNVSISGAGEASLQTLPLGITRLRVQVPRGVACDHAGARPVSYRRILLKASLSPAASSVQACRPLMYEQAYGKSGCRPNRKPTALRGPEKSGGHDPCDGHSDGYSVEKACPAFHGVNSRAPSGLLMGRQGAKGIPPRPARLRRAWRVRKCPT